MSAVLSKTVTITRNGETYWTGRYEQLADKVHDHYAFALVIRAKDAQATVNDTDSDGNAWSASID